jgi:hypothetical protein
VDFETQLFTRKFSLFRCASIAAHLDAMGIVDESVENALGQRGIIDLFMPL